MKRTRGTEEDDVGSSTETKSLTTTTPGRMLDHEVENSSSVSVTSEEFARQIRAAISPPLRIDAQFKRRASKQTSRRHRLIQSY